MFKVIIFVIVVFLVTISHYAQTVKGVIKDDLAIPIAEAEVFIKNTSIHTHTDINGAFSISVNSLTDTLNIIKAGFISKEVILTEENNLLDIELAFEHQYLNEVTISAQSTIQNQIANVDLKLNTKTSAQELLTLMPGLFIAQHAGGGKSEQMFLRGFDLDHGTDINIAVDNAPVNMVSHAHGQGYTDLHFVMPELIETVEFGKGPYNLKKGNFTTAGFIDFKTRERISKSSFSLGYGSFNNKEINGLFNLTKKASKNSAYVAFSMNKKDGYFESSQNFDRLNFMGKFTREIDEKTKIGISTSLFNSTWTASGQIPIRLVRNGTISRFGAVDDTEGGYTAKKSVQLDFTKYLADKSIIKTNVYYSRYDFELYSNFTFFERDSINGDQIKQKETRDTYGFNIDYKKPFKLGNQKIYWLNGTGTRLDVVPNSLLAYTKNRTVLLNEVQKGSVNETNYFAYTGLDFMLGDFHFNGGLRGEQIVHTYQNKLDSILNIKKQTPYALLPKASLNYSPNEKLNIYAKVGQGFHSNDSRLITEGNVGITLPKVNASDLGFDLRVFKNLKVSAGIWRMISNQEFVYVGDEGIVEPSGKTRRQGIDFSLIYSPFRFLAINSNINYTLARDFENSSIYIPLAAPLTSNTSIKLNLENGIKASWDFRYLSDRPADEFNDAIAEGYVINDFKIGYYTKKWGISALVLNIFNTEWNETQFLTNSKLQNESEAVEEIHFTPGTPRNIQVRWTYNF